MSSHFRFLFIATLAVFLTGAAGANAQTIRYVKASGAGDGSSWANASGNLQAMINASASGDQVWVAAGVYKPTTGTDRTISFSLKNGVAVYGGFPDSGDPDMDDRDWATHVSALSGDIGVAGDGTDNSWHVVFNQNVDAAALLDGFTVTGGNANGATNLNRMGGGMYNTNAAPALRHCKFVDNTALFYGGALCNYQNGHPAVTDCMFSDNSAGTGGGAVANIFSSDAVFTDCDFTDNYAGNPGYMEGGGAVFNGNNSNGTFSHCTFTGNSSPLYGGMKNNGSSPTLEHCTFSQNTNGGMYNYYASPLLNNCTFSQNTALNGAGMLNDNASPTLNNCSFLSNTATQFGGGAIENTGSAPTLNDCTFTGNTAAGYGGAVYNGAATYNRCIFTSNSAFGGGGISIRHNANAILNQCLFAGNTSENTGGAIEIYNASPSLINCNIIGNTSYFGGGIGISSGAPVLKNCSLSGNSATNGGGMYTFSTQVVLTNCILWGNNTGIGANPGIFADASYSIIQQNSGVYPGTGNMNIDPLFVDQPPVGLGTAGNLQLQECSPAIDAGTNAGAPVLDFAGDPRPFNAVGFPEAHTDMGALEYQEVFTPAGMLAVSISGPVQPDCLNPAVYTATPVNGGTSPVYQWKINGNNVGTNSPTFSTAALQNGDVVTCSMLGSMPCAYPVMTISNAIQVTVDPPSGDPSVFGDGEWRVHAWNSGGATPGPDTWNANYRGYYVVSGLNFNTENQWNANLSPSSAAGFQGCFVDIDNHSYSAKRRGFACAYYRLGVTSHDDAAQLWINGVKVWEHIGCCDSHTNVWEGFLGPDSEVEFRVTEGSEGSRGALSFQSVTPALTGLNDLCSASPATLAVSGGLQGDYLWSTGATTSSIEITASGTYGVSIDGGNGCSVTLSGMADGPAGDPAVFGDNEWRVYAWNAGGAAPGPDSWNTNYAGYYTATGLIINTQNQWNPNLSPSAAPGYQGCTVGNDNHSYSAKRRGLACAFYRLDITGHDDAAQLWIDGVKVWEHIGCCDSHNGVWQGFLDADSEVEFRVTEGGGGSNGSLVIQSITPVLTGLNDLCSASPATLAVSGGLQGDYLWSTGATTSSIEITTPGNYGVTIDGGNGCSVTLSGMAGGPAGDPAVFGNNEWRVYAWNAGDATPTPDSWNANYAGYYTATGLNFNTENQWNPNLSPSAAPGYQGCTVGNDNHSYSAKRRGFACTFYRLDIASHDDAAQLWIDGVKVWEHIGCCDSHVNVWQGYLDADSEVEFRVTEGDGGSRGALSFHTDGVALTGTEVICPGASNGTVSAPVVSGGSYTWNTGANTVSISGLSAGVYSVTVDNSAGCGSSSGSFTIEESVSITGASGICEGGSTTLQANIKGPVIWNSGSYTFTKTSPGQADAIGPNTHITRGSNGFIYNSFYQNGPSGSGTGCLPVSNTEWAVGNINDWASLTFVGYVPIPGCSPPGIVNLPLVLHLIEEDIYLQVTFSYWQGGGGGNFTYTRTTGPSYLWSTGETTSSITVNTAGTYTVTASTAICVAEEAQRTVAVSQPVFTAADDCAGPSGGQIAISGEAGGTGPYEYSIDNGASFQSGATFTGLASATYQAVIRDAGGCESDPLPVFVDVCISDPEISGKIIWEHDDVSGVGNVVVNLEGDENASLTTAADGLFSFAVASGSELTLKPSKNTNKLNGVTSADATRIQQHVANSNPITDPYKLVAADVNKSNSVTTLDATLINQALLGNPSALAQFKTSWRFVPVSHTMSMPPWGFPDKIMLGTVVNDRPQQDFYGIKTGDVITPFTNPANLNGAAPGAFVLSAPDQALQSGEQLVLTFSADQFADLAALQFALKFDVEKLALAGIEPLGGLPVSEENFGTYNVSEGIINVAWSQAEGVSVEEAASVFQLTFNVLETGGTLSEALQLAEEVLEGHAYTSALVDNKVKLRFFGTTGIGDPALAPQVELLQNRPNPFNGQTVIGFVLPEACEAQLRVFDAAGRVLFVQQKKYAAGKHEEMPDLTGASGVLWYELTTPSGILVKKMVAVGK